MYGVSAYNNGTDHHLAHSRRMFIVCTVQGYSNTLLKTSSVPAIPTIASAFHKSTELINLTVALCSIVILNLFSPQNTCLNAGNNVHGFSRSLCVPYHLGVSILLISHDSSDAFWNTRRQCEYCSSHPAARFVVDILNYYSLLLMSMPTY